MESADIATQAKIGRRITKARSEHGLTQAALAELVGMERTQLVRVESGERKVTVRELAIIARHLGLPIDSFVVEPPLAVLSRRAQPSGGHVTSNALDRAIDRAARDVQFLVERRLLTTAGLDPEPVPDSYEQAEILAARVRQRLGGGDEPLVDLGDFAERVGVVWYSLDLGTSDDGACVEIPGSDGGRVGVAVINGAAAPGRRRWTLAHEMGHFLVGDAYVGEHPGVDVERYINAFVAYFLMPRKAIGPIWRELAGSSADRVALAVAARYRTSWSAACTQLLNLALIDQATLERLLNESPSRGDFLAAGETWDEELAAPAIPRKYATEVLAAYASGMIAGPRALDLLRGTLTAEDLPSRDVAPVYTPLPAP